MCRASPDRTGYRHQRVRCPTTQWFERADPGREPASQPGESGRLRERRQNVPCGVSGAVSHRDGKQVPMRVRRGGEGATAKRKITSKGELPTKTGISGKRTARI